jgi:hypothetical protein
MMSWVNESVNSLHGNPHGPRGIVPIVAEILNAVKVDGRREDRNLPE